MEYRRLGFLPRTSGMEQSTEEFSAELDEIATFARDVLQSHSDRKRLEPINCPEEWCVQSGTLYARFEQWWRNNKMNDYKKPSQIRFSRRMKALGFVIHQKRSGDSTGKFFIGVKIKSQIDRDVIPLGQSMSGVVSSLTGNIGPIRNI